MKIFQLECNIRTFTVHVPNHFTQKYWNKEIDLRMSDREDLVQGRKLTDKHKHAAQTLLQDQFPHLQGLQSTLLSQKKENVVSIYESGGFLAEGMHKYWNVVVTSLLRTMVL